MKTYLIGDIGGQYNALIASLDRIGFNWDEMRIPEHVKVIQVGDLLRHRPHFIENNEKIIELVNTVCDNNPNWTQILGNHEAVLSGAKMPNIKTSLTESYSEKTIRIYKQMWDKGYFKIVHSGYLMTDETPVLFSHGGITYDYLTSTGITNPRDISAEETAKKINSTMIKEKLEPIKPGDSVKQMLEREELTETSLPALGFIQTGVPDLNTNPLWTSPWTESYYSWETDRMPYIQIHGHASPYNHTKKDWFATNVPDEVKERTIIRSYSGETVTVMPHRIDPDPHEQLYVDPMCCDHSGDASNLQFSRTFSCSRGLLGMCGNVFVCVDYSFGDNILPMEEARKIHLPQLYMKD